MAGQPKSLYDGALNGARVSRMGDAVLVAMEGIAFVAPAQDFQMATQWARAKQSMNNVNRDRMAFAARFENLVARTGAGIQTKGSNKVLQKVVEVMEGNGMDLKDYSIPHNLYESMEVKKKELTEEEKAAKEEEEKKAAAAKAGEAPHS